MNNDIMSRCCALTKTKPQSGNKVSHSQRKTRRKSNPNLQCKSIYSPLLKLKVRVRVTAKALKIVDKLGGIDMALISSKNHNLSKELLKLKERLISLSINTTEVLNNQI